MKHIKLISGTILMALVMTGCSKTETQSNSAPSIVGAKDVQCIVNTTVDFLDGVTALDREDGDITPNMKIEVTPEVKVVDGYATFTKPGEYSVTYSVEDSQGRTTQKRSYVDVITREGYVDFAMPNGFYHEVNGQASFKKCGMINGKFIVEATGQQVAEDVKICRKFGLKTNLEYTFTYGITSECAGKVKVLADNVECAEVMLKNGVNEVSFKHIVLDKEEDKQNVEIALCFGAIDGDIKLEINSLKTEYPQEEGKLVDLTESFSFLGRVIPRFDTNEGYEGNAWPNEDGSEAVVEVKKVGTDVWKAGMFINTGIKIKAGVNYVVSFDIAADKEEDFEVDIQRDRWDEHLIKRLYSNEYVRLDGHQEVDFVTDSESAGDLWLFVKSGAHANRIVVSNLKVEERLAPIGRDTYVIEDYKENHDNAYNCQFESNLGSYTYIINKFSSVDNQQQVTSPAFYVNGSGSNYVLSFTMKATAPIEVVVAAPVAGDWDPTLMWSRITLSQTETHYTYFFNGNGADRDYTVVWQFGSANNQMYENVEISVSDVSITLRNGELDG